MYQRDGAKLCLFGSRSVRMTELRCGAFSDDDANFALGRPVHHKFPVDSVFDIGEHLRCGLVPLLSVLRHGRFDYGPGGQSGTSRLAAMEDTGTPCLCLS